MSERNKPTQGKGDWYRPVKKSSYDQNYDSIDWSGKKKKKSIKQRPSDGAAKRIPASVIDPGGIVCDGAGGHIRNIDDIFVDGSLPDELVD